MTAKDKAKELYHKMIESSGRGAVGGNRRLRGIQCSLIAVNEILYALPTTGNIKRKRRFYNDVKDELNWMMANRNSLPV